MIESDKTSSKVTTTNPGDAIVFNTVDTKLQTIVIDGELFEIRPIGGGLLLDIEELSSKMEDLEEPLSKEDRKKSIAYTRQIFDIVESLLIQKGSLTVKDVVHRMPVDKLGELIKILAEI